MGSFIIRAIISAFGLWIATLVLPRRALSFDQPLTLAEAALLLGLANAVVRPILVILTLPITVLTLGVFLLVINAGIILLVAHFLHGFHVHGWSAALWTAIITGVVSWIGHGLTADSGRSRA
jgi:putative membrane protein